MLKNRPLGKFSNFVVDELPVLLKRNRTVIPSIVESLVSRTSALELWEAYKNHRELSLLDLKFAEVAMIRRNLPVPQILSETVDFFCGNGLNIPGLQYHELVELNPINDLRAFTTGVHRKTEALFYNSHRQVEHRMRRIVDQLENVINFPTDAHSCLRDPATTFDFSPIGQLFVGLRDMPEGHFDVFRRYIKKPCPVRSVNGPSGAYSWRIPYMEAIIWGVNLPERYRNYLLDDLKYYSPEGRGKLQSILQTTPVFYGLVERADDDRYRELIVEAIRFTQAFRMMHIKAIQKQLPRVLTDEVQSTKGDDKPGTFLNDRMAEMTELYVKFKEKYPE